MSSAAEADLDKALETSEFLTMCYLSDVEGVQGNIDVVEDINAVHYGYTALHVALLSSASSAFKEKTLHCLLKHESIDVNVPCAHSHFKTAVDIALNRYMCGVEAEQILMTDIIPKLLQHETSTIKPNKVSPDRRLFLVPDETVVTEIYIDGNPQTVYLIVDADRFFQYKILVKTPLQKTTSYFELFASIPGFQNGIHCQRPHVKWFFKPTPLVIERESYYVYTLERNMANVDCEASVPCFVYCNNTLAEPKKTHSDCYNFIVDNKTPITFADLHGIIPQEAKVAKCTLIVASGPDTVHVGTSRHKGLRWKQVKYYLTSSGSHQLWVSANGGIISAKYVADRMTALANCILLQYFPSSLQGPHQYNLTTFFHAIDATRYKLLWRQGRAQEALPVFRTMSLPVAALKCTLAACDMLHPHALLYVEEDIAEFAINREEETSSAELRTSISNKVDLYEKEEDAYDDMWTDALSRKRPPPNDLTAVYISNLVQHAYDQAQREVKLSGNDLEKTFIRILKDYKEGGYYKGRFNIASNLYEGPAQKLADARVLASFCDMAL